MSDPRTVDQRPEENGWGHNTTYWNQDGITSRESYDYDRDGNIRDLHYGERDRYGSHLTYNYHTDQWEDHSR
jgi:hypothetical protein